MYDLSNSRQQTYNIHDSLLLMKYKPVSQLEFHFSLKCGYLGLLRIYRSHYALPISIEYGCSPNWYLIIFLICWIVVTSCVSDSNSDSGLWSSLHELICETLFSYSDLSVFLASNSIIVFLVVSNTNASWEISVCLLVFPLNEFDKVDS